MAPDDSRALATRARHRLAENFTVAVLACLLLAAAGGFVAYEEFAAPDTRTEQETVATWTTDSDFTHQVTVQRTTRAFDAGTVLRDRSAYLSGITPELNATHVYRHQGDAESAIVSTNVTLVKRAVDPTAESGTVYWRVTEPLARQEATIDTGERTRTTFEINVSRQRNETRTIEAELGGTPGEVQLYAVVRTRAETVLDGQTLTETRTERLSVEPRGSTYSVTTNVTGERTEDITEPTTVPIESDPLRIYGGSLFALLWLVAAGALVWADRDGRLAVSAATVETIRIDRQREKFDEWISRGTVPEPSGDETLVRISSLEDLVDVAIDSERRVVEDEESGQFVVVVDSTWYVFEASDRPATETTEDVGTAGDGTEATADGDPVPPHEE
jgi:hypothetical protein